jgi:hypothetical protein
VTLAPVTEELVEKPAEPVGGRRARWQRDSRAVLNIAAERTVFRSSASLQCASSSADAYMPPSRARHCSALVGAPPTAGVRRVATRGAPPCPRHPRARPRSAFRPARRCGGADIRRSAIGDALDDQCQQRGPELL